MPVVFRIADGVVRMAVEAGDDRVRVGIGFHHPNNYDVSPGGARALAAALNAAADQVDP
jgi:hypothetical protein